jgi:hypothetical protein
MGRYRGRSWSWSYGSWIYNYLCKQCLSLLTLWVQTPLRRGVLDTTLCDKVCQWLATGRWFSPVSSTHKTDCHDITEILLKVALNTITITLTLPNIEESPGIGVSPWLIFLLPGIENEFTWIVLSGIEENLGLLYLPSITSISNNYLTRITKIWNIF